MSTTLVICQMIKVEDSKIFEFLDHPLHEEDEPTDLDAEAENFCYAFIEDNYLDEDDDVDPTEVKGFNELKEKIKAYLFLKRHNPEEYKRLEEIKC